MCVPFVLAFALAGDTATAAGFAIPGAGCAAGLVGDLTTAALTPDAGFAATLTWGFGAAAVFAGRVIRGAADLAFEDFVMTLGADLAGRTGFAGDFADFAAPVVLDSAFTNAPLSIPAQPRTPRLRARLASSAFDLSLSDPAVFIVEPLPAHLRRLGDG